jgi:aryl-alcohol dehydrogenase-like predicted oxidoreductase
MGLALPVTLQQQYSFACREIEYEVIPAALHNNIGLLPWSPLAAGFLSGRVSRDARADAGTRLGSGNPMYRHIFKALSGTDRNWRTLDVVRRVAGEAGASPAQVALSWITHRPAVTSTIIGARTMAQLRDNMGGADLVLDAAATAMLDAVSAPSPDDYPYGSFGSLKRHRYLDSSEQALRELPA